MAVLRTSDEAVYKMHGLDAYACCRFLRLCVRVALACCVLSCGVLLPAYARASAAHSSRSEADDDLLRRYEDVEARRYEAFVTLTLRAATQKVASGASEADDAARCLAAWLAVVVAYVLALFNYSQVRREYREHRDKRCAWLLASGEPD